MYILEIEKLCVYICMYIREEKEGDECERVGELEREISVPMGLLRIK